MPTMQAPAPTSPSQRIDTVSPEPVPAGFFQGRKKMEKALDSILAYQDGSLPDSQDINELTKGLFKGKIKDSDKAKSSLDMMADIAFDQKVRNVEPIRMQRECLSGLMKVASGRGENAERAQNLLVGKLSEYVRGETVAETSTVEGGLDLADRNSKIAFSNALGEAFREYPDQPMNERRVDGLFKKLIEDETDSKIVDAACDPLKEHMTKFQNGQRYLIKAIAKTKGRTQSDMLTKLENAMEDNALDNKFLKWQDLGTAYMKSKKKVKERLVGVMRRLTSSMGVDFDPIMKVWMKNCSKDRAGVIGHGLQNMAELEKRHTGGVKYMHETYNIHVFARYSSHMMKKIIDDDVKGVMPDEPTIVTQPFADWNGAWLDAQRKNDHFVSAFGARFYECGNKSELAGSLGKFSERFGKIKHLLLGGHGYPAGLSLGDDLLINKDKIIRVEDLAGELGDAIKANMANDGDITMISCSTGSNIKYDITRPLSFLWEQPGVAKTLSQKTGLKTSGPTIPGHLIILSKPRGSEEAVPEYEVPSRTYKDGELVEEKTPPNYKKKRRWFW